MKDQKLFTFLHFVFALTLPLILAMVFSGCLESEPFLKVDPGPPADPVAIEDALNQSSLEQDPAMMKVGQFVHTEEVNDIANGAAKGVISDTGETLVQKDEQPDSILFTVIETRVEYLDHGNYRAASTEKQYQYIKPQKVSSKTWSTKWYVSLWNQVTSIFALDRITVRWSTARAEVSDEERLAAFRYVWPTKEPKQLVHSLFAEPIVPMTVKAQSDTPVTDITYHRFKTSTETIPAPPLVQKRANCGGLASCKIRLRNVEFDQVIHRGADLERIHFDFATSSDVPYFATNFKKCITLMVPLSTGTKTVLKQCANVVDFRFESDPQ